MDDETREALKMSKSQLVEMLAAGEPTELARQAPGAAPVTMHSTNPEVDKVLKSTSRGPAGFRVLEPNRVRTA